MNELFSSLSPEKILNILLILLGAVILSSILRSFIKVPKSLENRRRHTYASVLRNIISVIVYIFALNIIFEMLKINIAPLLASAGIIGLSIGLGAKALIEDLIGGVMLLSQNSISIGDYVEIDGSVGRIENIGFRTLTIRAKDGSLHIIPNGMVKKVINFSRKELKSQTSKTAKK